MRRLVAPLISAVVLVLALAPSALAQGEAEPPEGCPGTIFTSDASGNQANEFQSGETVYVRGEEFPPNEQLDYTVTHIQSGVVVGSGSFSSSADGSFLEPLQENRFRGRHQYKVEVTYVPDDEQPEECTKSSNFFAVGGAGSPEAPPGEGGREIAETGFPAAPVFLIGVGLISAFLLLRLGRTRSPRI